MLGHFWVCGGTQKLAARLAPAAWLTRRASVAFTYCQAGLEGSEDTDGLGYRDELLIGTAVSALQAFPCNLGTWTGTSASVAAGCATSLASR